jgi:hypothetical protein
VIKFPKEKINCKAMFYMSVFSVDFEVRRDTSLVNIPPKEHTAAKIEFTPQDLILIIFLIVINQDRQ